MSPSFKIDLKNQYLSSNYKDKYIFLAGVFLMSQDLLPKVIEFFSAVH